MHELELVGVVKTYNRVDAIRGIDMRVGPGITALLGPNGAGKSTLMRIIATVARPSRGTVRWDGVDVVADPRPLRRVLGYLPQDAGVYPQLDAREFLEYIGALKGLKGRALRRQIDDLLEELDLEPVAHRHLATLSGGNRQRVAIAQALLGDPQLLVVDEPSVGLDPEQRIRLRDLLRTLARDRIILLSTHIVSDIETTADRVIIVAAGQVVADRLRVDMDGAVGSLESFYVSTVGSAR
jgi:ABC-type multidrug transport system ATPase subunit